MARSGSEPQPSSDGRNFEFNHPIVSFEAVRGEPNPSLDAAERRVVDEALASCEHRMGGSGECHC